MDWITKPYLERREVYKILAYTTNTSYERLCKRLPRIVVNNHNVFKTSIIIEEAKRLKAYYKMKYKKILI